MLKGHTWCTKNVSLRILVYALSEVIAPWASFKVPLAAVEMISIVGILAAAVECRHKFSRFERRLYGAGYCRNLDGRHSAGGLTGVRYAAAGQSRVR